jgi:hypothetical protein
LRLRLGRVTLRAEHMKNDPTQQSDIESKASPDSGTHRPRRAVLLAAGIIIGVAGLLVACGGGGGDDKDAAVQEAERAQALGLFDKLPVSWVPAAITFSMNPGARQDVPITLTTKVALKNAKVGDFALEDRPSLDEE